MADLDDVKGNSRDRRPQMGDLAAVYKFPDKKWVTLRLLPGMEPESGYWVSTKKKDGKSTKFYIPCPSFDAATQERDTTKVDPWRDLQMAEQASIRAGDLGKDEAKVQYAQHYWMVGISRLDQKKRPSRVPKPTPEERKSGFKDKDSDSWTPKYAVKVGRSLAGKLKDLKGLNTVESTKTGAVKAYQVNDSKFGRDVRIYFDKDKAPADQYQVQLGDKRTPLTEEEIADLTWDLSQINATEFDPKAVQADFDSWAQRNGVKVNTKKKKVQEEEEDDEDFDEEDDAPVKKKAAPAKKTSSKKPPVEDDDEEDEDSDEDDFDDEEDDDAPATKKGKNASPAPKKKKPAVEDDDFDEDDFDEDDDEEDGDDADEDEDADDFDDEDEAPVKKKAAPAKKTSSPASKKKPVIEEDDDDFDEDGDDFDEDDEEDEAPVKKKAAAKKVAPPTKKAAPAKKKKPVVEEDDEDEDDFDDED